MSELLGRAYCGADASGSETKTDSGASELEDETWQIWSAKNEVPADATELVPNNEW